MEGATVSGPYSELTMHAEPDLFGQSGNPKILVVDDEPTNIQVLTHALRDYDLVVASSAEEALNILEQNDKPHLILLDIMMPGTDGLQMCRDLKARRDLQHIPVIFITALSDSKSEEKGYKAGAVDYIHKPIRLPAVRARVRTHISLRGMLDHITTLNKELKNQIEKLGNSGQSDRNLFERVFMATSEGIILLDANHTIIAVNAAFSRITGYSEHDALNESYAELSKHIDTQPSLDRVRRHLEENDHWSGELHSRRKSGELYPELRTISTIRSTNNDVTHYVVVFNDISSVKETEQRLEELKWRDPVTGLSNRALFLNQLGTVLKFCTRGKVSTAVLVIDINNFRYINETFGFKCGDIVIKELATRLCNAVFTDDSIARLSGDEFGIVLAPKQWTIDDAYRVIIELYDRIQNSMAKPILIDGQPALHVEVTVGAALYPTKSSGSPASALQHAETAHRSAKEANRPFAIFEDSMSQQIRHHLKIERELNHAIEQDQLVLFAQPQLRPDKVPFGLEILVRWDHPERGLLGPGEFIPLAENTRQIVKVERWILRKSMEKMAKIHRLQPDLHCSINISIKHFAEDDFGTGYSSLSRLQRLPISEVKIDRSFVLSAPEDPMNANIVEMVVRIGDTMGARVVAEGVETKAHPDFLASEHPHVHLQGYYFGIPQPIERFMDPEEPALH